MNPEVVFSGIFVASGAAVCAVEPSAWPGAGMLVLIGAAGLWDAARAALARRRAGSR